MRRTILFNVIANICLVMFVTCLLFGQNTEIDRTVLPIKSTWHQPIQTIDARDATAPPVIQVKAPDKAPNIVIIMIDDIGFGGPTSLGGVLPTPHFDKLAESGLLYTQFHTTSLCSPTRQSLKTGRNHHSCNQAKITELATSFPGATGQLPNDVAPLAKMLSMNGWSTAAFGKWHETAVWEISPSGPMDRWPNRQGFDKFYGFMGGETNQWAPTLYDNANPIEPPDYEGYHLMNDMTTQCINWMRFQQTLTPDKPFFIYFTPGAVHAPHHVPKEYIKKYKGKFDEGWDVIRERTYVQQKEMGLIPANTKLADKPDDIKDWVDLSDNEKKLFARQAEVFAAFLEMTDAEIGRFLQAIKDLGEMDNTLIYYIAGDNGTSAEGGLTGLYNEMTYFNNEPKGSDVEFMLNYYDDWGAPNTYPHFAAGWAVCFDSPFMWTKQVASNYGGTRNGLVVHWPDGIKSKGEIRTQWHHVIDVAPTILEACKLPEPRVVDGVPQRPIEGVSMLYSFDDANSPDRHKIQYFEMFGNRGVYFDGWFAGTVHKKAWANAENTFSEDVWELYHVKEDFSMAIDLADTHPEVLKELQKVFLSEAVKYNVLPLDDRLQELLNPTVAGRPDLMFGRKSLTLYEGMGSLLENDFINVKNSSIEIIAQVETDLDKTNGVIIQQGGRFGGWSLYVTDNKPAYAYNYLGLEIYNITGKSKLPNGESTIKLEFAYDGDKPGSGGLATLYLNGKEEGSVRIDQTECCIFSGDETANVGMDKETMVTDDYDIRTSRFNAKIDKVTITLK